MLSKNASRNWVVTEATMYKITSMLGWNDLEVEKIDLQASYFTALLIWYPCTQKQGIIFQFWVGSYLRWTNPLCLGRVAVEVLHWAMQPRPHEHLLRPPTAKNEDVEELRLLSFRLHWSDYCFLAWDEAKAADTSKEAFEAASDCLDARRRALALESKAQALSTHDKCQLSQREKTGQLVQLNDPQFSNKVPTDLRKQEFHCLLPMFRGSNFSTFHPLPPKITFESFVTTASGTTEISFQVFLKTLQKGYFFFIFQLLKLDLESLKMNFRRLSLYSFH